VDFIRIKASLTTAFTFTSVFSAFLRMNLLNGISAALTVANAIFAVRTTVAFALDISITGFQNAFSNRNVIAICIPSAVTGVCKKTIISVAGRDFKSYLPILQHTLLDIFVSKKQQVSNVSRVSVGSQ
jgi:hypothetical protein